MPRNTDNFISEQFEEDLLDAYFHFRNNLPVKDEETGLDYKKSYKTTQDIATELDDMGGVSIETINQYMQAAWLLCSHAARRYRGMGYLGESCQARQPGLS